MAFKRLYHKFSTSSVIPSSLCNIIPHVLAILKYPQVPGKQNLPYAQKATATLVHLENSYLFFKTKAEDNPLSQNFLTSLMRVEQLFFYFPVLTEPCVLNIPVMLITFHILFFCLFASVFPKRMDLLKGKILPYPLLKSSTCHEMLTTNEMLDQFVELTYY